MTARILFSSIDLGPINDAQLQQMLDRFSMGKLTSSKKTSTGVMGQTRLVSSSAGEFVLKGNPIYPGQFKEEQFFVDQLHQRTKIPVATPYIVDEVDDIFGWSYALMPRLPGEHLTNQAFQAQLNKEEQKDIAKRLAETLVECHNWLVKEYGELDSKSFTVQPFEKSYKSWLYNRIRYWLEDAKKYSVITSKDHEWVEGILEDAENAFAKLTTPTFVMGDFKPENILLKPKGTSWQVSGLIDFTNSYFGDGIQDLAKMLIFYIDNGEEGLADKFLSIYKDHTKMSRESLLQRLKVHMLDRCVLNWGCSKAINQVTWDKELPFSNWAKKYIKSVEYLIN